VDHVVPLSKGGEHTMRNSRTAHLSCNSAKHADLIMPHAHCP
jgi:5-methylcytosine-specific restriction endonuclease McrA